MESDIYGNNIRNDIYTYSDERESTPVIFSMLKKGTYHPKGVPIICIRDNQMIDWNKESICCFHGNWRNTMDT
jgi:hypothetical protein